ncbi:MAG: 23S rRNA (guanosine(2251)-2'-O)-methyltransferase RlmB [Bacteroidales bacterium]
MREDWNQEEREEVSLKNFFGVRAVIEAIKAGKEIDKVLFKTGSDGETIHELFSLVRNLGIPYQFVPIEKLNRITRKNHQGVIALASAVEYQPLSALIPMIYERGEDPFLVILDRVTDVRNVGAIARSAECAGAHALIVPDRGSAPLNGDAVKTSAGALHHLPVCRSGNLKNDLLFLKESGIRVVAVTEKSDITYLQADLQGPVALLMGAEDTGISPEYLRLCHERVSIPMFGKIGSLNVSAAAAVLLFDVVRRRTT